MKFSTIAKLIFLSVCLLTAVPPASAAPSARDIMMKADDTIWKSYTAMAVKVKLSTCKYVVKEGGMRCIENPRVSLVENAKKHADINKKNAQTLAVVIAPISDKGLSMLIYEYDAHGKDNDNWLYLPALAKVKRVVLNSEDEESGSYFGTEFSLENTENLEARKVNDYTYKIIGEETYDGHPCWLIESTPTSEKAKKTKYSKLISWIEKDRYLLMKENLHYRDGTLHKQRTIKNYERIDGVWIARKITMNNLSTRRVTKMDMMSVAYNMEIPDEFFTQRSLTDFPFRERYKTKINKNLK